MLGRVRAVAFSPDGTRLVTGGYTLPKPLSEVRFWRVRFWDASSGQLLLEIARDEVDFGMVTAVAFSPDGTRLATDGNAVRVWDAASGQRLLEIARGEAGRVRAVAFSPDGTRLAVGDDNSVWIWRVAGL
jgi:WD40 repeat protein